MIPVDLRRVTPAEKMAGEDADETAMLRDMLIRAETLLRSFSWCPPIAQRYLGVGIGGVLALFLFRFARAINNNDEWLWVVVGDLPSVYFVVDEARDPASALGVYCDLMQEWVDAVASGSSLDDVYPVDAAATKDNADMLRSRVKFIREQIVPSL
ncbi:MAG TPA: hypothetical protein VKE40_25100 [Gemmataceae bacterium]|nr:hypothetical protein [Gemmataceae bacterium]